MAANVGDPNSSLVKSRLDQDHKLVREPGMLAEDCLLRGVGSIKWPEANRCVYPLFPLSVKELLELRGVPGAPGTVLSSMFAAR